MTEKEIIRDLMRRKKINEPELGRIMGYKSNASVWKKFHRNKNITVGDFLNFLDVFDMEAVVRPKGKYRTKYKLTRGDDD